jgi:hypothetical protein
VSEDILIWAIGFLLGLVNLWFWADRKRVDTDIMKTKDTLISLNQELSLLSNRQQHYTTHSDVKDLIRESVEPIMQSQRDTMMLVREINNNIVQLSKDLAIINALRDRDRVKHEDK